RCEACCTQLRCSPPAVNESQAALCRFGNSPHERPVTVEITGPTPVEGLAARIVHIEYESSEERHSVVVGDRADLQLQAVSHSSLDDLAHVVRQTGHLDQSGLAANELKRPDVALD